MQVVYTWLTLYSSLPKSVCYFGKRSCYSTFPSLGRQLIQWGNLKVAWGNNNPTCLSKITPKSREMIQNQEYTREMIQNQYPSRSSDPFISGLYVMSSKSLHLEMGGRLQVLLRGCSIFCWHLNHKNSK